MRPTTAAACAALIVLTACAGIKTSKLNPFNWFQRAAPEALEFAERPKDPRLLVATVSQLVVEPTGEGAIIRASGLPPSQGWWEAELVRIEGEDLDVVTYEFRLFPPVTPRPAGTARSRQITVATALSTIALEGITKIVVLGQSNALSSRR